MTGEWIQIGGDSPIQAWSVPPRDARRGGVVVLQEIFGVNANIREICEAFAEHGYDALAPALFDRLDPGFETSDVNAETIGRGKGLVDRIPLEDALSDCQAAIDYLALDGPVFMTGFCYGGSLSWLAAQHCRGLSAISSFYGRLAPDHLDGPLLAPVIAHFGRNDESIPMVRVEALKGAYPDVPVYVYEAGHGFMRKGDGYREDAAKLAWLRTLQVFQRNSGSKTDA